MHALEKLNRIGTHMALAAFALALAVKPEAPPMTEIVETMLVLVGMGGIRLAARVAETRTTKQGRRWGRLEEAILGAAGLAWIAGAAAMANGHAEIGGPALHGAAVAAIAGGAMGLDRHMQQRHEQGQTDATKRGSTPK